MAVDRESNCARPFGSAIPRKKSHKQQISILPIRHYGLLVIWQICQKTRKLSLTT